MKSIPSRFPQCHKVGYVLQCYINGRKKFKALGAVDAIAPTLLQDQCAIERFIPVAEPSDPTPIRKRA